MRSPGATQLERRALPILVRCLSMCGVNRGLARGLALGLVLGGSRESAAEPHRHFLDWKAPEGCPEQLEIERGVKALLRRPSEIPAGFSALAVVARGEAGYRVELRMGDGPEAGARQVEFSSCREAADFVVLSVALAIDPHAASADSEVEHDPAELAPAELGATAGNTAADDANATSATEEESAGRARGNSGTSAELVAQHDSVGIPHSNSERSEASGPSGTQAQRPSGRESETFAGSAASASRPHWPVSPWFVTAGVQLTTGLLPQFAAGPMVELGRRLGHWTVGGDFLFLPGAVYDFSVAPHAVRFRLFATSAGGCRVLDARVATAGLCARVQVGTASAREQAQGESRQPHGGVGFYLAFLLGMQGSVRFSPHFRGKFTANLSLPALSSPFELADGTLVHQLGVGFQGSFGLEFFF